MPSSLELINLKFALSSFDPKQASDAYAMHLLQMCVMLDYQAPVVLLPYIGKAVDAWGKTKGNKIAFNATQSQWNELVWYVHFYYITNTQIIPAKEKKVAAINTAIMHLPRIGGREVTYESLERHYDRFDSRAIKEDVEEKHGR